MRFGQIQFNSLVEKISKKQSLTTEERAQIVTMSNSKFFVGQIAKRMKVSKTVVRNAIIKYQTEAVFIDKKRSGRPRVTTSRENRLMRKTVTHLPMRTSKKSRKKKLMETGTAVSTKNNSTQVVSRIWP